MLRQLKQSLQWISLAVCVALVQLRLWRSLLTMNRHVFSIAAVCLSLLPEEESGNSTILKAVGCGICLRHVSAAVLHRDS